MRKVLYLIIFFIAFTSIICVQASRDEADSNIIVDIENLKVRLAEVERRLNSVEIQQTKLEENLNDFHVDKYELVNTISSLRDDIEQKQELLIERYDAKLEQLAFWQNLLNTVMVFGGLYIGFIGVSAITDYRKKIVKEKLDQSLTDEVINNTIERSQSEIKAVLFEKFSGDISKLSSRVEELEKYEPVFTILKEMKKQ